MTETNPVSPPAASSPAVVAPAAKKPRPPRRWPLVFALFALLFALLSLMLSFYLWDSGTDARHRLEERVGDLRREIQDGVRPGLRSVTERQDEYTATASQLSERQQAMEQSLAQTTVGMARLSGMVQGGRRSWQLYEVEYLLLTANDRLQLQSDVPGAIRALEAASQRIAGLSDPLLTPVRERVVQEIAALRALPQPDVQEIAMTLAALAGEVPQLPLEFSAPDHYTPPASAEDKTAEPESGWARFLHALRKALHGLAYLRRDGKPLEPLLPPEQEFFLYQNLTLKLETARLAVLQRDTQTFRNSVSTARAWLQQFYSQKSPPVAAAVKELTALEHEDLQWTPPDISQSLVLLRKQMETRGVPAAIPEAPAPTKPAQQQ